MEEVIFSEVSAKVSVDFLSVVTTAVDQHEKVFADIAVNSGVKCIQDDLDGTWVVYGDLNSVNQAYGLMLTIYNLSQLDVISNEVRCAASCTPSFNHPNDYTEVVRFAANTPVVPSLIDDADDQKSSEETSTIGGPIGPDASVSERTDFGFTGASVEESDDIQMTVIGIQPDGAGKSRRKRGLPRKAIVSQISKKIVLLGAKELNGEARTLRPRRQCRTAKSLKKGASHVQDTEKPAKVKSGTKRQRVLKKAQHIEDVIEKISRSKLSAFGVLRAPRIKRETENQSHKLRSDGSVNHRRSKFICPACGKTFSSSSNLSRHQEVSHSGVRYDCAGCDKKFTCNVSLQRHERIVHRGLRCDVCREIFASDLLQAQHDCPGTAVSSVRCRHCGKNFSCTSNLNKHVRTQHSSIARDENSVRLKPLNNHVVCSEDDGTPAGKIRDKCSTTGGGNLDPSTAELKEKSLQGLNEGNGIWNSRQPIRCKRCDKVFSNSSNLQKHDRIVHNNVRFRCLQCTRVYTCKEQLSHHVIKVHQGLTYRCEICREEFKNRLCLAKHQKLIHSHLVVESSYQCEQCGKTFLYKNNLRRHRKQDHEGVSYSCQVCRRSFKTLQLATEHELVSHKGQSFDCLQCDKKFTSRYKLKEHAVSTHTSLRPHRCAVCGEQFSRYSALSYHLQRKHERHVNVAGNLVHLPKAGECQVAKSTPHSDPAPRVSETGSQFVSTDSGPFDPSTEDDLNQVSTLKNLPSVIAVVPVGCSLPKITDASCFAANISADINVTSSSNFAISDVSHLHGILGHLPGVSTSHDALQPRPLQSSESLLFPSSAEVDGGHNPYLVLTDSFSFYDSLSYSPLSQTQSHDVSFYNSSGSTF